MTSTMPSRGGISRREQEVEVGQVHLETRIIKESTWQWRYKAYGDLGAVFCGMGERVVCSSEGMVTLEQHGDTQIQQQSSGAFWDVLMRD